MALFAAKRHRVRSAVPFRESPETIIADAVDHGKGWVHNNRSGGMEDLAGGETLRREHGAPRMLGERDADWRRNVRRCLRFGGGGRFSGEGCEKRQDSGATVVDGFAGESLTAATE